MIGLVIADDEQIIRQGLAGMPWQDIGVEVVGVAANGTEALNLFRATAAQIILTDIRMPGPDGIDLLHIIREERPCAKVILLTGYQEFEYAYSAIKYKAFGFILKPTDYDEVLRIVGRAKEEVEADLHSACRFGNEQSLPAAAMPDPSAMIPSPAPDALQEIMDQMRAGNYHMVETRIVGMLSELSQAMNENMLKDVCIELVTFASHLMTEEGMGQVAVKEHLAAYNSIRLCAGTEALIRCTNGLVVRMMDAVHFPDDFAVNKTVEECLSYINQCYMNDITLASLAKHIHRSPIYLSRLIKKVKGRNFTEILACVRMDAACKLLKSQDIKSYEVSERVGIKDPRYFSQIFKKQFGVTPTAFRNNLLLQYTQRDGEFH